MSRNRAKISLCLMAAAVALALAASPAFTEQKKAQPAKAQAVKAAPVAALPPNAVADGDLVRLKNITINKKTREIRIAVKTAIDRGILEYLLVGEKGKAYESAFKTVDALPSELHFALILIGCEALPFDNFMRLLETAKGREDLKKNFPQTLLTLEIAQKGKSVPLSTVVRDREGKKDPLIWVHTGGRFLGETPYRADQELSFIGVWPDVSAVINLFSGRQNPYRGNFGFEMNTRSKGLKKDQDYEIVIRRYSK